MLLLPSSIASAALAWRRKAPRDLNSTKHGSKWKCQRINNTPDLSKHCNMPLSVPKQLCAPSEKQTPRESWYSVPKLVAGNVQGQHVENQGKVKKEGLSLFPFPSPPFLLFQEGSMDVENSLLSPLPRLRGAANVILC